MMTLNVRGIAKLYFKSFKGLSYSSWRGILFSLFESLLIGIFYFLSIYFVNDLHLSVLTSGFIISFYGVGAILGGYLGGYFSDKFSSDFISAAGLIVQAICYSVFIWVDSLIGLVTLVSI